MIAPRERRTDLRLYIPADFSDIKGREHVKRVLEVAAAGSHNVIMTGPPGAGKTLLARANRGVPSLDSTLQRKMTTTCRTMSRPESRQNPQSQTAADNIMCSFCFYPCPCGFFGDPVKECTCSHQTVTRYQKRISGPLLDRIDTLRASKCPE